MRHQILTAVTVAVCLLSSPTLHGQSLDDAQIADIAVTANQLDITAAEQALEKSSHPEVRRFAETMIRDHQGVIEQAAALADRLGLTPADNEMSRSLTTQAEETLRRLGSFEGASFDRAYIENEVAYHEAVITAVAETLIPNTSHPDLRQLLQDVLPALRAHLDHARQVRERLGSLQDEAFDRAYIQHEVTHHEAVIATVQGTLIPNVASPELRALLEGVVPALEAHLDHPRQVGRELGDR